MSKQVLSIEQMQRLKELGVDTSGASMCWRRKTRDFRGEEKVGRWSLVINQPIIVSNFETYEDVTTFTLQDILDLLPNLISSQDNYWLEFGTAEEDNEWWYIRYMSAYGIKINYEEDEYLIDAAYEMLCWCIENEYIKINKKNN